MKPIPIQISNPFSIAIYQQVISVGVPLPQGTAFDPQALTLALDNGVVPVYQFNELSRWPDDSLRWVLVQCLVTLKPGDNATLYCQAARTVTSDQGEPLISKAAPHVSAHSGLDDSPVDQVSTRLNYSDSATELLIDTGLAQFTFSKTGNAVLPAVRCHDRPALCSEHWGMLFKDASGSELDIRVTEPVVVESAGDQRISVRLTACYRMPEPAGIVSVQCRFTLFAGSATLGLDVTLHNPAAATHPGGYWDLGDEASVLFREFSLVVTKPDAAEVFIRTEPECQYHQADRQRDYLVQWSSGGPNWDSRNHVDASGRCTPAFPGYQRYQESLRTDGRRASPSVRMVDEHCRLVLSPARFWQNFPKTLEILPDRITLGLFPDLPDQCHEMQGGERKTHVLYADFSGHEGALEWVHSPMPVTLSSAACRAARVFAFNTAETADPLYDELVNVGLDPQTGFMAKREVMDEYGWRHFGDLYADHETWNYPGDDQLISHYNNQYDAVYGFARQYCLSGDTRWFTLCQDLASHVMDIDIYRTTEDREQYNNGLFWHTNHYVQAFTATHRTFSVQHADDDAARKSGGGGPGSEHCYTTGLALYYYLTGDVEARNSVLLLTDWITRVHEGSGTLLESLLTILKRDVPDMLALVRGDYRFAYRYPLNRGTGNFLTALLDSYELNADTRLLTKAEAVISESIGPADDIAQRQLHDVESNWSYTVYLQALIKYLLIKVERGEFDSAFLYARTALLHYAQWMADNEQPYLDRPERLEFINDTWAAQDIRKACILIAAHQFRFDDACDFLSAALVFRHHVISRLSASAQRAYTRILVILMQNHGPTSMLFDEQFSEQQPLHEPRTNDAIAQEDGCLTKRKVVRRTASRLFHSLRHLSLAAELAWLRHRIG